MSESGAATPPPGSHETRAGSIDIRSGHYGFHYTRDEEIADLLRHGLLSRMEERSRGLTVRRRASRSPSDTIYFTTQPGELYLTRVHSGPEDHDGDSHGSQVNHAVGIVVDRPDFADQEGHFGIEHAVDPHNFKALVFIDQDAIPNQGQGHIGAANHDFGALLDPASIAEKTDRLKAACQEAGLDIPICGVSGAVYYDPQLTG